MSWQSFVAEGLGLIPAFIYHRWIEDKPPGPRPRDVALPQVDEGTPVPLIYGRCRVRSAILAFSGNYIPADPPSGPLRFGIDMLFVVGVPFFGGRASLYSVYAGDIRLLTLVDPAPGSHIVIASDSADPFTATDFVGEFYDGNSTQDVGGVTLSAGAMVLAGVTESLIPGYRNLVCCMAAGLGGGTSRGITVPSPVIPSFDFEVSSLSTGTPSDLGQSLTDDADPAAVIYDLLTSPWGKLALPASKIDFASFQAASIALTISEGHGYSRTIEQTEDASSIISDVLRQIDGVMYEEPTTGKLVLKLIRNDYVVADLDDINPDNVLANADGSARLTYSVQGWSETMNQVRVTFTLRESGYCDGLSIGQNAANVVAQGGKLRSVDIRYVGCCTRILADKLASRELAVSSRPMVKATVTVNRTFYATRPGDVHTLTWPELGIVGMVMRVARVDLGELHAGAITLDLIRDVFDVSAGAFPTPVPV